MEIAKRLEHTVLKAEATKKHIDQLLDEAKKYNFRGICVNGSWVKYAKDKLVGTDIKVVTVVGFPLGATMTQSKVHEAQLAIKHGADEVDMVINIGRFKDGQHNYVLEEIDKIKATIGKNVLKVIVETALLSTKEKEEAAQIVLQSKADYIKTSTGFSYSGATVEDIKLFKKIVGDHKKIKASAGIKNYATAKAMVDAGADVIGTSSGPTIVDEEHKG